ncbi:hypothetical protein J6590_079262 [Homalodisca vitripennis]|nr:hypothetical protein J6590_079262 [Homalodisca vitripennis]
MQTSPDRRSLCNFLRSPNSRELVMYGSDKAGGTLLSVALPGAVTQFVPELGGGRSPFKPYSVRPQGLCEDLIKQNKGECRYSTRSIILIKRATVQAGPEPALSLTQTQGVGGRCIWGGRDGYRLAYRQVRLSETWPYNGPRSRVVFCSLLSHGSFNFSNGKCLLFCKMQCHALCSVKCPMDEFLPMAQCSGYGGYRKITRSSNVERGRCLDREALPACGLPGLLQRQYSPRPPFVALVVGCRLFVLLVGRSRTCSSALTAHRRRTQFTISRTDPLDSLVGYVLGLKTLLNNPGRKTRCRVGPQPSAFVSVVVLAPGDFVNLSLQSLFVNTICSDGSCATMPRSIRNCTTSAASYLVKQQDLSTIIALT